MRIMIICGTRPEAIKVAPVITAIEGDPRLEAIVVTTGQHREMLDQVNEVFGIVPCHDLDIMSAAQTLNDVVARVITGVDAVVALEKPDAVIVQGDTSTAVGAAIAAFNRKVPVIHLEAGLRSGDIASPFPEEANRKLIAQIAALHLAPTVTAKNNLLREGVEETSIVVTGNTVLDALIAASEQHVTFADPRLEHLRESCADGRPILLLTTHRRENLGRSMRNIGRALAEIAQRYPDALIVFPIHKNPRVRADVLPPLETLNNVIVTEPLTYSEFTTILGLSTLVLTDSGGIQEEAPSLGKPVLVMRDNTERPEAVDAGTVKLVGTSVSGLVESVSRVLDDSSVYAAMTNAVNPYGDGHAARYSIEAIVWMFLQGPRPTEFNS